MPNIKKLGLTQPASTVGTTVNVRELMDSICNRPILSITALQKRELGEIQLLGLDVVDAPFQGDGKVKKTTYWPSLIKATDKQMKLKSLVRLFSDVDIIENAVELTEFSNDANMVVSVWGITNGTVWVFSDTTGFKQNDTVLIVKGTSDGNTVSAKVKIAGVDHTAKEITFNSNVTIDDGDYIQFITTDTFWCQKNDKGITNTEGGGKSLKFNYQLFSRKIDVKLQDFNKTFAEGSEQYDNFIYTLVGKAQKEIWLEAAKQFRHGTNTGWTSAKTMGYDTLISLRQAGWLDSIIDFASITQAKLLMKAFSNVLYRVAQAPVDTKFVLIGNHAFIASHKNVLQSIRIENGMALNDPKLIDTIYDWIMKYEVSDSPMIDFYQSDALTLENPVEPVAYILPMDLIAAFIPPYITMDLSESGVKTQANQFAKIYTMEHLGEKTLGCRTYEHYMSLGYVFGGFSFRDTYFKLTGFKFEG